jgi:hypothetical protein
MKRHRLILLCCVLFVASPAFADDSAFLSAALGIGAVDQDAIGGALTGSLEIAVSPTPVFSFGLRGGYFSKDDSGGAKRDTLYGVAFGRARWPRPGLQPFVEAGGGRYEFEDQGLDGWFGGLGADVIFSKDLGLLLAIRYHSVPRPPGGALPDFAEAQAALHFRF